MDLAQFWAEMRTAADAKGYAFALLGRVGSEPIYLVLPRRWSAKDKRLLVAAGFHGDEQAGPLAIKLALSELPVLVGVSVAFLPVVNPTGLARGTRESAIGQDPNRGYPHHGTGKVVLETRLLLKQWKLIRALAHDGFLALHEDRDVDGIYLYTHEHRGVPGLWSKTLRDFAATRFKPVPDGTVEGSRVERGLVFNECADTMEDALFHDGAPVTACVELPGKVDLLTRVRGGAGIVYGFIQASKLVSRSAKSD